MSFIVKAKGCQVTLKNDSGKKMLVIPVDTSVILTETAITQCSNNIKALLSIGSITLNKVINQKKELIIKNKERVDPVIKDSIKEPKKNNRVRARRA